MSEITTLTSKQLDTLNEAGNILQSLDLRASINADWINKGEFAFGLYGHVKMAIGNSDRYQSVYGRGKSVHEAFLNALELRAATLGQAAKITNPKDMREAVIEILDGKVDKDVFEAINAIPIAG